MAKLKTSKADRRDRPHFNAVDAMIIILVVFAVIGIYFKYNIIDLLTADSPNDEYIVSFSIKDIRYTTPNYMDIGDTVYFASSGEELGTLLSASENQSVLNTAPSSVYVADGEGSAQQVFYPEQTRVDATGRLLCVGSYTPEGGFCIGGDTYIAAGQTVSVYTERVSVVLTVTSIEAYAEQ